MKRDCEDRHQARNVDYSDVTGFFPSNKTLIKNVQNAIELLSGGYGNGDDSDRFMKVSEAVNTFLSKEESDEEMSAITEKLDQINTTLLKIDQTIQKNTPGPTPTPSDTDAVYFTGDKYSIIDFNENENIDSDDANILSVIEELGGATVNDVIYVNAKLNHTYTIAEWKELMEKDYLIEGDEFHIYYKINGGSKNYLTTQYEEVTIHYEDEIELGVEITGTNARDFNLTFDTEEDYPAYDDAGLSPLVQTTYNDSYRIFTVRSQATMEGRQLTFTPKIMTGNIFCKNIKGTIKFTIT